MMRHVAQSPAREFIVATETGILHRMRQQSPDKVFYAAKEDAACRYMKMITLEKVLNSLENDVHEVRVPEEVAARARLAIERMVQIT
jgi:quinolinate synthase